MHKRESVQEICQSDIYKSLTATNDGYINRCFAFVCPPTRYVIAIWASIGFILDCALRINLSVALVAMVNATALHPERQGNECPFDGNNSSIITPDEGGTFLWNEIEQGYVLGAFFWGYIPLQVPAGFLAERYGGKWIFGGGILWAGLLTLLTPLAARNGLLWIIVLRTLEGIGESVTYPAMSCMLGQWAPLMESSFIAAIAYSGTFMGYVIGTLGSGYLIDMNVMGGWPSTFYIPGILTCIWFVCWSFVASDNPANHPRISAKERELIEKSIGLPRQSANGHLLISARQMPWKRIFLSAPVWALIVANFCTLWSQATLLTCLPQYFFYILGFTIKENGLLNALPYILMWLSFLISCRSADLLRKHKILSTTATRKTFNTVGMLGNAGFLLGVAYVGCDRFLSIVFLCAGALLSNINTAGVGVNHLDLAPQYAGTIFGIENSIASMTGFICPLFVGALTDRNQTRGQWQKVFYVSSAVTLFGALFYLIFSSGERQSWAKEPPFVIPCEGDSEERRPILEESEATENNYYSRKEQSVAYHNKLC